MESHEKILTQTTGAGRHDVVVPWPKANEPGACVEDYEFNDWAAVRALEASMASDER